MPVMTRVTVLLPVGPSRPEEFVLDTAESLRQFLPDARYVVLDDRDDDLAQRLGFDDATVLPNPGTPGRKGLLYNRLSSGLREALGEPFDLLLRIDDDAVVQGNSFV